jgi:hypothetical protein
MGSGKCECRRDTDRRVWLDEGDDGEILGDDAGGEQSPVPLRAGSADAIWC